uniref:Uncharacterized protein n=1 Tax=Poecilia formosa TaxID=48698 RepID=A0A096LR21_POEFO
VNGRVEGAVAVADPEEELEQREGDLTRVSANPVQAVAEEKGEPAHHEHPHDHSQDELGLLGLWTRGDCALAGCGRALAVTVLPLPVERRRRLAQSVLSLCDAIRPGVLPRHTPGSGFGHLVYPDVHQDHYQAGREEGGSAGGEDVPGVVVQLALRLRAELLVAVDRHERRGGDEGRDQPHDQDDALDALRSPLQVVLDSLRNGPVPVQADCAQVHDGGGAEQHVQSQIDAAPNFPEIPVAHEFIGQREGHHQSGDQDVRGGQGHQEQVLGGFQ